MLFLLQYNIKKKEELAPPPCEGRLTIDKKGPIPLPDDDDSKFFLFCFCFFFFFSSSSSSSNMFKVPLHFSGFDPIKIATDALNSISEKLPFKLPWKSN